MYHSKAQFDTRFSPKLRVPKTWNVAVEPSVVLRSDEAQNEQAVAWVLATRKSARFRAEFITAVAKAIDPFLTARMYFPFCKDEYMLTEMEKFELVAFFMDDVFEHMSHLDNKGFDAYINCWRATLSQQRESISAGERLAPDLSTIKHDSCPWYCESVTAWFLSILCRVTQFMNKRRVPRHVIKAWYDRWNKSHLKYLRGCKAEGEYQDHNSDNFAVLRDATGIVTYCLLPAEAMVGPLPEDIIEHEALMTSINRLYYSLEESIGYFNDLISFTKEDQQAERVKNIVAILSKDNFTVAEAIEKSRTLHDQCVARAHAEMQRMRDLWPSQRLDRSRFLDAICQCAIGCDVWHHMVPRYRNSLISPQLVQI